MMVWKQLNKGDVIKGTGYVFQEEVDIAALSTDQFKDHRRLRVFHQSGTKCSNPACRNIGTRLIQAVDKCGGIHWDIFTDSLILMTVDHILSKNKGGNDYIKNLQPMCKYCNGLKGDLNVSNDELAVLYHERTAERKVRKRELREEADC